MRYDLAGDEDTQIHARRQRSEVVPGFFRSHLYGFGQSKSKIQSGQFKQCLRDEVLIFKPQRATGKNTQCMNHRRANNLPVVLGVTESLLQRLGGHVHKGSVNE